MDECVYVCVCVCVGLSVCLCGDLYVTLCPWEHTRMYVCVCVSGAGMYPKCVSMHKQIYMYECMCVCVHRCVGT